MFTLIELIVTIGLMVLMSVMIANNLTSIFTQREEEDITDFKVTLEEAACLYIDLSDPEIKIKKNTCKSSGCYVTTAVLWQNGLLDEELMNPLTGQKITGSERITIQYQSGEKKCTFNVG